MRLLAIVSLLLATVALGRAGEPYVNKLKGNHSLWEDFEGGKVCNVMLTADQTIGGFVFKGDSRCMKVFKFDGDPHAWFIDQEGWMTIVDATRRILVRLKPNKDGSFYANSTADRLENLNLTQE